MNMPRYNWGYLTEPEPGLGGRRLVAPRGKVIGGSSSINGMAWVRGHPRDYDAWEEAGAAGWGWRETGPYFRRIEDWRGGEDASRLRGRGGPMRVRPGRGLDPLVQAFLRAGQEAGHPLTPDHNGASQEGVGPFDATIHNGLRWSAADGYLRPALRRGARLVRGLAERIVFDGKRARGVKVRRRGRLVQIRARAEVIVCASAFNSPKLLMLSGIGPGAQLAGHGIEVRADRPGVGRNLQDHMEVYVQVAGRGRIGLHRHWSLMGKARVGLHWLVARAGPGASNQFEAVAFLRSGPMAAWPDVQFHFLPLAVRYDGRGALNGFQIHAGTGRSRARGTVTLANREAAQAPVIRFGYLTHEQDVADLIAAVRLARQVLAQPALAAFTERELAPGPEVETDADLAAFLREHAESAYHPCGTCRMGSAEDPGAVVDPDGRVIGVEGLRVADSSIFPLIPNGNINAPSIMVGERIADRILGRSLPPLEV
jgi:choline dehydrogenase